MIVPFGSTGDWNETFQIVEPVQHNIETSDRRLGWPFDENEPAVRTDVVREAGHVHVRTCEQELGGVALNSGAVLTSAAIHFVPLRKMISFPSCDHTGSSPPPVEICY